MYNNSKNIRRISKEKKPAKIITVVKSIGDKKTKQKQQQQQQNKDVFAYSFDCPTLTIIFQTTVEREK